MSDDSNGRLSPGAAARPATSTVVRPASAVVGRPRPDRRPLTARTAPVPRPAPVIVSRRDRRRIRIVEKFVGKRLRNQVGFWRRLRSGVALLVLTALLAAALAAVFAAVVAGLVVAFHHASGA